MTSRVSFRQRGARGFVAALALVLVAGLAVCATPVIAATGSISGTVTDSVSHVALQGVEVCAFQESGEEFTEECDETDASGKYTIGNLPGGEYLVEFWPGELDYLVQYYNGKSSFEEAELVTVGAGDTPNVNAAMQPAGQIKGKVTASATGTPVEEVIVCAVEVPEEEFGRCGETNPAGDYAIPSLRAGEYKVEFWPGFTGLNLLPQYYNHKASWAEAEPIEVALGATTAPIDAQLDPGAEIRGTVLAASNNVPLKQILVCSVSALTEQLTHCTETNSSGHYALLGLPSSSYKVAFSLEFREFFPGEKPEPDGYLTQFYNGKATLAAADVLALTAPNVTTGIDAHLLSSKPSPVQPPPTSVRPLPKVSKRHSLKCRKHFRKKKVKGKVRCVRVHHKRRHRHPARPGHHVSPRLLATLR